MANCQGSETREKASGVNPNDILDEREMTTERGTYQRVVDDFLTVGRDIQEEYGTAVGEFLIANMKDSSQAMAYYDGENIAINEVDGYDADNDNQEYFTSGFTFPYKYKKQIVSYLNKHKSEITEDIIRKAIGD